MRFAVVGLLAVMLAACGEPDPPAVPEPAEVVVTTPVQTPESAAEAASPDAGPEVLLPPDTVVQAPEEDPGEPAPVLIAPLPLPAITTDPDADLPKLAIIIDDVGHGLAQGRRVINLPAPVALAILPHTQAAERLAAEARAASRTVMLHLPMENQGGLPIGPGGLYAQMPRAEFDRVLAESLNSISGVQGVNNHMGSLLTTLRPQMDWLMEELARRELFFVDSRTSAQTQAAAAAKAKGIPHLSRHVFLDNLRTPEHLAMSFDKAVRRAREQGHAVVIGHPYPETLTFLEQRLTGLEAREGVRVVPVETLLDRP